MCCLFYYILSGFYFLNRNQEQQTNNLSLKIFFLGNHVSEAQIIGMSDHLQRTVSTAFNFRFTIQNSMSSRRSQARDP